MARPKNKTTSKPETNQLPSISEPLLSFSDHLKELRWRLFIVIAAVIVGGGVTYAFNEPITQLLLRPAGSQQFIFTSPGGGFDFLFRLCLYGGLLLSVPVLLSQVLGYVRPMIKHGSLRLVRTGSIAAAVLATVGVVFGYVIGLPAAMYFLLNSFSSAQIQPLITIQSYLNFVLIYLLGCALLFQIPLILLVINRIKPLRAKALFQHQRWFILGAFVLGAIINPSPNIQDQLLLAIPMIAMYELSIGLIWLINRRKRIPSPATEMLAQD